ncbi:NADH:ubiquinone reductase (Na(+)-transporting) subunit B [Maribacter sp. PR1]|uniref:Na(+)-translocating NADH-quinone reductase subunit B n=1 Tax=Maribacter cobaltidurans TaxID=1178778 RepID=A0ABU7IYK0_9FLAO|nr:MULTISPECIES: NADH:ubiquinone reductase (Na(+)-transporting) subunit B [Maribacter]MDC6390206.1 NADH:ubiquinone reductase (Na(+)-transporting) subunit B [Maribacter sp. PR1]MEE1977596.1 NADH:ubiquinone reductase (Na(+)-transporting) subunit B [Maribacter cobaltidurans]
MSIKSKLHELKLKYQGKKMAPAFNAFHTFLFTPNETTHAGGTHVKAADDLKRTMNTVIMALIPVLLFSMFNAGYQHYAAIDAANGSPRTLSFFENFLTWDNFWIGIIKVLPLVVVSYGVGLIVEFIFAVIKGHEVEEGYLVTGMLVPLIVPVDTPLWMLAVAVVFGVVIGKEVFGGTGMNILNPALTIRAFLFFAYPTWMSGDKVWVHGAVERAGGPDAISGETILGSLAQNSEVSYSISDMFFGFIPGSVGETSTLLILIGGLFLIFSKIASWRIMLSAVIGSLVMGLIFNQVVELGWITETSKFYGLMSFDFWKHLIVGGLAFGIVYMATDPVTGSQTNRGKWFYGFFIGFISVMIRVFNPAYPEGVFLAILLMNVFAPTIDHYVVKANINKRMKRLKNAVVLPKDTDGKAEELKAETV